MLRFHSNHVLRTLITEQFPCCGGWCGTTAPGEGASDLSRAKAGPSPGNLMPDSKVGSHAFPIREDLAGVLVVVCTTFRVGGKICHRRE